MGLSCVGEVLEDGAVLLAASLDDREHRFDEAAAAGDKRKSKQPVKTQRRRASSCACGSTTTRCRGHAVALTCNCPNESNFQERFLKLGHWFWDNYAQPIWTGHRRPI
jgi:hypothetical protein